LYTRQPAPRGLGDALCCATGFAGERPVVVALGDTIVSGRRPGIVTRMVEAFDAARADAAVAVEEVGESELSRYGIVAPAAGRSSNGVGADEPFAVADVVEKPLPAAAPSRMAI